MSQGSSIEIIRIEICPTNHCSMQCPFCHGPDPHPKEEIPLDLLMKRLKEFRAAYKTREVTVSGGEPTEYEGIIDLLQRLHQDHFKIRFCVFYEGFYSVR